MIHEIVALIDTSGSMLGKEKDTINGINASIEEIKSSKINEIVKFTLTFFNEKEFTKVESLDIENVTQIKIKDFVPKGRTALLDTLGDTINKLIIRKLQKQYCFNKSFDTCFIYVVTDGYENYSIRYNSLMIKDLVEEAKKYNIEIVYIGANQDAIQEAAKIGININSALTYDETTETIENTYRTVANVAKRYRNGLPIEFLEEERKNALIINF